MIINIIKVVNNEHNKNKHNTKRVSYSTKRRNNKSNNRQRKHKS